jgi:hypothetical protein
MSTENEQADAGTQQNAMDALADAMLNKESEKKEEPKAVEPCPRCKHRKDGNNPPNDDDIQEYARSILGSRQFTKTYKLMGGQIKFTFTTLDGVRSEHLNNLTIGMNQIDEPIRYSALSLKYRTLFMLKEIDLAGKKESFESPGALDLQPGDYEKADEMFSERIEKYDQGVVQMMAQSLMLFRTLESSLIQGAFDETFWTGAGPC